MLKHEKTEALADTERALPRRYARPAPAADLVGFSRSFLYELLSKGAVKSHRVGCVRLVDLQSLHEFIAGHPS